MIPSTSPSILMQIQPQIQKFARMLSSILQLEVEIIDSAFCRVAGTGMFSRKIGQKLSTDSRLLHYIIETKKEKIVTHSRIDPLCKNCSDKADCQEKAFLGTPVMFHNQCVGVISLVALNGEQQKRINDNIQEFSDYIRHVSTIFVSRFLSDQPSVGNIQEIFLTMIENMDQGVLVVDNDQKVKFVNQTALKILDVNRGKIIGRTVRFQPLTFEDNFKPGHRQHVITFDDRKELVVGQLHVVQDRWLFLMAFHQPYSVVDFRAVQEDPQIEAMVGECRAIRQLKKLIGRVAPSPSSVMITGESGTGKEVVARAIHRLSGRQARPFIAINCAAIPEQLLESELFGYVKGAFTGASANGKVGLIQAANQGTLFLDEIGDMPLTLQAKLLRTIESREIQPVGASGPVPVDIRIISATHQNIEQCIADGKFREDLYYRLNVIPLHLPPLRERQGDIELLLHYFLHLHTHRLGLVYPGVAPELVDFLKRYTWPGNIRELSNLIEYLVNVVPSGEVIDMTLLPPNLVSGNATPEPETSSSITTSTAPEEGGTALEEMEKHMIRDALSRYNNKKQAADELGIGIATLYRKIKKYSLAGGNSD
ncbi:sigma-54-dependent Fis family transcriptional regulator [Salmonella enterica subsp. enterica serovar Plymouth]|nr:PAS domain-containing protein [Salmonella enterica subsp. enterica serovar Plymouth]EBX4513799.1 sigma-54-dependent Fis family transcriptional regulator [Salmonella enterica subsp. enterica serovar Plymouth]EBY2850583.1 PAS domain-containing protein [Salmonella enterica subsp. enterica serovar Plymouth]EEE9143344.1 PAS domain-containing protein [Salmonella enterica subsp. enterica serovar Plymouth]